MKRKKNSKFISRFLSLLLTLVMVVTMLPAVAKADTTGGSSTTGTTDNSGLVLDKTATLEDDGTYTINLEAYATGTTTTITEKSGVPLDIVLVIDQSGSMVDDVANLRSAVTTFVANITQNAREYNTEHRIAMVGFAANFDSGRTNKSTTDASEDTANYNGSPKYWVNTGLFVNGDFKNYKSGYNEAAASVNENDGTPLSDTDYKNALVPAYDKKTGATTASITTAISKIKASGGTRTHYGMEMANKVFVNNPIAEDSDRKRITVVFTDGEPGENKYNFGRDEADDSLSESYKMKSVYDATVYTVGLFKENPRNVVDDFMHFLSSNYTGVSSLKNGYESYNKISSSNVSTYNLYYRRFLTATRPDSYDYELLQYYNKYTNGTPQGWKKDIYETSNTYDPLTTQFYEGVRKSSEATKYYMTTDNSDELTRIFTNITDYIENSTTTVKLDKNAVMRDVLGTGFVLGSGFSINSDVKILAYSGESKNGTINFKGTGELKSTDNITASYNSASNSIDITGFDFSNEYIAPSHSGRKLAVQIKGVEATENTSFDSWISTNGAESGIYKKSTDKSTSLKFPQPQTILTSKSYVLDYGKKVELSSGDWKQSEISCIRKDMTKIVAGDGKDATSLNYGKIDKTSQKDVIFYTPGKINWDGYDSFYALGKSSNEYANSASIVERLNANTKNIWSKINVIPATSVYYEDDFMSSYTDKDSNVKIVYSGEWTRVDNSDNDIETSSESDRVQSSENDKDTVYGNDQNYANDSKYSDGSAHKVTGNVKYTDGTINDNPTTAEFNFTGTGVDIYSRTDLETGSVVVRLKKKQEDGSFKQVKMITALQTWEGGNATNKIAGTLYQIPTVFFKDLEYGTYKVVIEVSAAYSAKEPNKTNLYYLDGIRVYEPIKMLEKESVVGKAYGEANEANSYVKTMRDLLINEKSDNNNTGNVLDIENVRKTGALYIDRMGDDAEAEIGTYEKLGPKNEVYLSKNNGIAFNLKTIESKNSKVCIGLKAPEGKGTKVKVYYGTNSDEYKVINVNSASDLYYDITPEKSINASNIIIKNEGDALLSVTKIRISEVATSATSLQSTPELVATVKALAKNTSSQTTTQQISINDPSKVTITEPKVTGESVDETETLRWRILENNAALWLKEQ